jgi:hypothetical protein
MINSILTTHFLFSQTLLTTSMMLNHLASSMMNSRREQVELGEGWLGRVAGRWAKSQKFIAGIFFLFIIKSILATHFFFFQLHTTTSIMLTHLPSSLMNSRCEKDKVREKWLGKVAGR